MRRLSIVIPNFNYAEFIEAAIDSALSVDWPDVEVIVVDDGSTDDSRERIEAYGPRVTALFQANAGPRVACNAGFAISTGDAVIFLDSDDRLAPAVAREAEKVWSPEVSKIQFEMRRIDRNGDPTGTVFPHYHGAPTPEQVRSWMRTTSSYPTAPGSGNLYARSFLEKIFPLDGRCGDATDSATLAAAPFLGDVVTIAKPLADYRQHGDNRSHLLADPTRFTKQIDRAYQRHLFALDVSGAPDIDLRPLFRSRHLLQLRVARRRLRPMDPPLPGDSARRMFANALTVPFAPGPETIRRRLMQSAWSLATLVAPQPLAERLITARFRQPGTVAAGPRPRFAQV